MLFENLTKHDVQLNLQSSHPLKWLFEKFNIDSLSRSKSAKLHVTERLIYPTVGSRYDVRCIYFTI